MIKTWNGEGGSNGVALTTVDTGSGNAVNAVDASEPTYSTAAAYRGTLGLAAVNSATSRFQWTGFAATTMAFRSYYLVATPTASTQIQQCRTGAGQAAGITHNSSGVLNIVNSAGTGVLNSASIASRVGTWIRIEWQVISSATVGQILYQLFDGDSTSSFDSGSTAATVNTRGGNLTSFFVGNISGGNYGTTPRFDDLAAADGTTTPLGSSAYTATLANTATITADGVVGAVTDAALTVTAGITAAGTVATSTDASLTVTATITAAGSVSSAGGGTATVTGTATITAAGVVATATGSTAPITTTITAAGVVATSTGATLTGTATIAAAGTVARSSGSTLNTAATITTAGTVATTATASITGSATITAAGTVFAAGTAQRAVTVTIAAAGSITTSSTTPAERVIVVAAENRTVVILAENRTAVAAADPRATTTGVDNRTVVVAADTRTDTV